MITITLRDFFSCGQGSVPRSPVCKKCGGVPRVELCFSEDKFALLWMGGAAPSVARTDQCVTALQDKKLCPLIHFIQKLLDHKLNWSLYNLDETSKFTKRLQVNCDSVFFSTWVLFFSWTLLVFCWSLLWQILKQVSLLQTGLERDLPLLQLLTDY